MRDVSDKFVDKLQTHIWCSVTFFRKSCRLWDNVEKYCRAGQAKAGNMAHAHCVLDNYGYKHTHTQDMWYLLLLHCKSGYTGTHLNVTLYVHCLVIRYHQRMSILLHWLLFKM